MFESNDWDLDQDLFNEVDKKAFDYYSQLDHQETATKKRKIAIDDSPGQLSNVDSLKSGTVDKGEDKQSRKNLILGLFNKNSSDKNISRGALIEPKRSCDNPLNQTNIKSIPDYESDRLPRKNLVLNILRNNNSRSQEIREDNTNKSRTVEPRNKSNTNKKLKNDVFKSPQKKMTIVRKFPGPAGLLPDDIDSDVNYISCMKSLEENEVQEDKNPTDLLEYCSQNTTNLFSEGAWQLMLNDLPCNFLNEYAIASIKQKAGFNSRSSMKVKFLAGILEHIDYSHENPPIVLRDYTDSIRGIVHKDIPLKYPDLLEQNVVLLLRDVGLLKISGIFAASKYQILISPSSLLAIYTGKNKIKRTEHMESIFGNSVDRRKAGDRTFATTSDVSSQNSSHDKKPNAFNDNDVDILMDFDSDVSFLAPPEVTDLQNDCNKSSSKIMAEKPRKTQNSGESSAGKTDGKKTVLNDSEIAKTERDSGKKLTEIESDPDDELLSQIDINF